MHTPTQGFRDPETGGVRRFAVCLIEEPRAETPLHRIATSIGPLERGPKMMWVDRRGEEMSAPEPHGPTPFPEWATRLNAPGAGLARHADAATSQPSTTGAVDTTEFRRHSVDIRAPPPGSWNHEGGRPTPLLLVQPHPRSGRRDGEDGGGLEGDGGRGPTAAVVAVALMRAHQALQPQPGSPTLTVAPSATMVSAPASMPSMHSDETLPTTAAQSASTTGTAQDESRAASSEQDDTDKVVGAAKTTSTSDGVQSESLSHATPTEMGNHKRSDSVPAVTDPISQVFDTHCLLFSAACDWACIAHQPCCLIAFFFSLPPARRSQGHVIPSASLMSSITACSDVHVLVLCSPSDF
jgi:hypothetical protein